MYRKRSGESLTKSIIVSAEVSLTVFFTLFVIIENKSPILLAYLLFIFIGATVLTHIIFYIDHRVKLKALDDFCCDTIKMIEGGGSFTPRRQNSVISLDGVLHNLSDSYAKREKTSRDILTIVNTIASNTELSAMMNDIMRCLLDTTKSNWGAFYLANNATGKLELKSSVGFDINLYQEFDINIGEGLIGSAAKQDEIQIIRDIPADTVFVTKTFIGKVIPKNIMVIPIANQNQLLGTLALASFNDYGRDEIGAAELYRYYVAIAVVNCVAFERAERARNEIVFQNNLIQDLNKELLLKVEDKGVFMKTVINCIKDCAVYVLDRDGIVLEWNSGAENLYGYKESQAVGRNIGIIYTDEEIGSGKMQQRIDSVLNTGSFSHKGWKRKRDGTFFYADIQIYALYNEKNDIIGMTNLTKDITKHKLQQTETYFRNELLKTLMENGERAVLASDGNGRIEYFNDHAKKRFGKDDLRGLDLFLIFAEPETIRRAFSESSGARLEISAKLAGTGTQCLIKANLIEDKLLNYLKYIIIIK